MFLDLFLARAVAGGSLRGSEDRAFCHFFISSTVAGGRFTHRVGSPNGAAVKRAM